MTVLFYVPIKQDIRSQVSLHPKIWFCRFKNSLIIRLGDSVKISHCGFEICILFMANDVEHL